MRDLPAHIEKVEKRLRAEDLSAIELRGRYRDVVSASDDLVGDAKAVKLAEGRLIMDLVREAATPPPTVAEQVATLRDQGENDSADSLESTAARSKLRVQIKAKRAEIAELSDDDLGRARGRKIAGEIENLEKNPPVNPYFERIAEERVVRQEREKTLEQARKMVSADLMTQDEFDVLQSGGNDDAA